MRVLRVEPLALIVVEGGVEAGHASRGPSEAPEQEMTQLVQVRT